MLVEFQVPSPLVLTRERISGGTVSRTLMEHGPNSRVVSLWLSLSSLSTPPGFFFSLSFPFLVLFLVFLSKIPFSSFQQYLFFCRDIIKELT
jgi:hypothetical protein